MGALAGALPGCCMASASAACRANRKEAFEVRRDAFGALEDTDAVNVEDETGADAAETGAGATKEVAASETNSTSFATPGRRAPIALNVVVEAAVLPMPARLFAPAAVLRVVVVAGLAAAAFPFVFVPPSSAGRLPPHVGDCLVSRAAVFSGVRGCRARTDGETATAHAMDIAAIRNLFVE